MTIRAGLLCLLCATLAAQEVRVLDAQLAAILERHDVPALGAAVVLEGELVALGAAGVRARGAEAAVTADDLWHLGSCTKSMTATLIARLVERGTLRWELTLAEAFPDLAETMAEAYRPVSLAQLLSHTAGCPADLRFDGLWMKLWKREGTPRAQRRVLTEAVLAREPAVAPGEFLYSNAGVAIAGVIAEEATDTAWEELLRTELFEPLGIEAAGFGAPGSADTLDQPRGHGALGPMPPGPQADNPPAIGPAGTVHASLTAWAKYAALHASGGELLRADSLARLHAPAPGTDYALGWVVTERPWAGGTALTHSGSNTMWYAVVWIAPARELAVLVTTNIGGNAAARACDEVAAALIGELD